MDRKASFDRGMPGRRRRGVKPGRSWNGTASPSATNTELSRSLSY
jgi:hypothetical protein